MTDVTLRSVKGSALTWDEADTNFDNLRDAVDVKAGTAVANVFTEDQTINGNRLVITGEQSVNSITITSTAVASAAPHVTITGVLKPSGTTQASGILVNP